MAARTVTTREVSKALSMLALYGPSVTMRTDKRLADKDPRAIADVLTIIAEAHAEEDDGKPKPGRVLHAERALVRLLEPRPADAIDVAKAVGISLRQVALNKHGLSIGC